VVQEEQFFDSFGFFPFELYDEPVRFAEKHG
jgi:hypothetical protein